MSTRRAKETPDECRDVLDESHGLVRDLALGVIGSSAATAALTALDLAADVGPIATAFVAFAGAALLIIAQRKFWHAHA